MPALTEHRNPPVRDQQHSTEFLVGQHSLFLAGIGQAFFYMHEFKPFLPAWIAGPLFLAPWSIVFVLFYHERAIFETHSIRRWWLGATVAGALLTVVAELIWMLGLMPQPTAEHRIASDVFVQVLMNLVWLSFIPMVRDYRNHPELWS
jgi:hypothetical protein